MRKLIIALSLLALATPIAAEERFAWWMAPHGPDARPEWKLAKIEELAVRKCARDGTINLISRTNLGTQLEQEREMVKLAEYCLKGLDYTPWDREGLVIDIYADVIALNGLAYK